MTQNLLLLDEPAAGLFPVNVDNLMCIIIGLKDRYGIAVVVLGHVLNVAMDTCNRVAVLTHGVKIGEGTPLGVRDNLAVVEAFLGRELTDVDAREALLL